MLCAYHDALSRSVRIDQHVIGRLVPVRACVRMEPLCERGEPRGYLALQETLAVDHTTVILKPPTRELHAQTAGSEQSA